MTKFEILTMPDIAQRSGLSVDSIRTYRTRGKLPPEDGYLGRVPYWNSVVIDSWISNRRYRGQRGPAKKAS